MDILSYVNSNAIREHLRNINYEFNSIEAAWLIYWCNHLSYKEKKAAWLELMNVMPDMEFPDDRVPEWKTIYEMTRDYIKLIDKDIECFFKEDVDSDYVYMYSYRYKGSYDQCGRFEKVYRSLEACNNALDTMVARLDNWNEYDGTDTGVDYYLIRKQSLDDPEKLWELMFTPDGNVKEVRMCPVESEAANRVRNWSFERLWFDFPTPFKKGDIVWVPTPDELIRWDCDGGFVLLGLSTWNPIEYIAKHGDSSDMNGFGYFLNPDGTVYQEVMINYMDLEYYEDPYNRHPNERILPALSKFVKGEIGLDFLLCAYKKVHLDIVADDVMLWNWYPKARLDEIQLDIGRDS